MNTLPKYLTELVKSDILSKDHFTNGLTKFLRGAPDLFLDYPKLPTYLSLTMLTLIELNAINSAKLEFPETDNVSEENLPPVDEYFTLFAELLK